MRAGAGKLKARGPGAASLRRSATSTPRLNAAAWRRLAWPQRYLIAVRAAVLPMTLLASLFGGLLALPWSPDEGWRLLLVSLALILAHAASNLLNDQIDYALGIDSGRYFRLRYGTQPLAQGLMGPLLHALLLLVTGGAALLLGLAICAMAGPPAYLLLLAGSLLLIFYTWPLKRLGFGEVAVLLVWGPLMVGGCYWVVSGDWGPEILVASLLFGLGPTVVVVAKHADKRSEDAARGIRTLPVMLGARHGAALIVLLAVSQVVLTPLWGWLEGRPAYFAVLITLPALWTLVRVCVRPRPTAKPASYPAELWPLWYTAAGFRFALHGGVALTGAAWLDGVW